MNKTMSSVQVSQQWDYIQDQKAEIKRLHDELAEARAEVARLQKQLWVAVGMLSAQPHYADRHPEEVLKIIEEETK